MRGIRAEPGVQLESREQVKSPVAERETDGLRLPKYSPDEDVDANNVAHPAPSEVKELAGKLDYDTET